MPNFGADGSASRGCRVTMAPDTLLCPPQGHLGGTGQRADGDGDHDQPEEHPNAHHHVRQIMAAPMHPRSVPQVVTS